MILGYLTSWAYFFAANAANPLPRVFSTFCAPTMFIPTYFSLFRNAAGSTLGCKWEAILPQLCRKVAGSKLGCKPDRTDRTASQLSRPLTSRAFPGDKPVGPLVPWKNRRNSFVSHGFERRFSSRGQRF